MKKYMFSDRTASFRGTREPLIYEKKIAELVLNNSYVDDPQNFSVDIIEKSWNSVTLEVIYRGSKILTVKSKHNLIVVIDWYVPFEHTPNLNKFFRNLYITMSYEFSKYRQIK